MEEKESLPTGVITMLLEGYIKTIMFQRNVLYAALIGWAATTIAFVIYLSRWYTVNITLKNTRDWLLSSTRRSFSAVLMEAKITPRQLEICELKFVKGLTSYQIAMEMNLSVKTIDKELNTAYKQITNVLASFWMRATLKGGSFFMQKRSRTIRQYRTA